MVLPPSGRWALGEDAQVLAELLLAEARRQNLRIAWLGAEAGFLSNLSVQENLRMMYEWDIYRAKNFSVDIQSALTCMNIGIPEWLRQRPSQLLDSQMHYARLLRVLLLRPDILVLDSQSLVHAEEVLGQTLAELFPSARLLLLAEASPHWLVWPNASTLPVFTESQSA